VHNYWQNIARVAGGAIVAQAIPFLGSFIIARLYAPDAFGEYSVWVAVVTWLVVIMTCRLEQGLALISNGDDRALATSNILTIAVQVGAALATITFIALLLGSTSLSAPLALLVMLVPTALMLAAIQTIQFYNAAEGRYGRLNFFRILIAASILSAQLASVLLSTSSIALAAGHLIGVAMPLLLLLLTMPRKAMAMQTLPNAWRFLKQHKPYALYSMPADLINKISLTLPVIFTTSNYGPENAGLLAMAIKILGAPISLVGASILDVYRQYAASEHEQFGRSDRIFLRTLCVLSAIAAIVFFAGTFLIQPASDFLFDERWRSTGSVAIILLPLFCARLITSPLTYSVYIAGKQWVDLAWQLALLTATAFVFSLDANYELTLAIYCWTGVGLYAIYLALSFYFAKGELGAHYH
jgi:O-antigen/teichoic acid export membrane protein